MNKILSIAAAALLLMGPALYGADETAVDVGKKVTFQYSLVVDGKPFEDGQSNQPKEIVYGQGALIPAVESAMKGMKAGERKELTLEPLEAFGEINPDAVVEVPKTRFKEKKLKKGTVYALKDPEGRVINGMITDVKRKSVVMDFNHPLAGKVIVMNLQIISVQ